MLIRTSEKRRTTIVNWRRPIHETPYDNGNTIGHSEILIAKADLIVSTHRIREDMFGTWGSTFSRC